MTKAELLAELATKYETVDTEELLISNSPIGYNQYTVKIWDFADTTLVSSHIKFYVYDEGGGSEAAYYSESTPKALDFQRDLEVYVDTLVAASSIKGAYIEDIDLQNENAVLRVIKNDYSDVKHFADRDGNGDIQTNLIS